MPAKKVKVSGSSARRSSRILDAAAALKGPRKAAIAAKIAVSSATKTISAPSKKAKKTSTVDGKTVKKSVATKKATSKKRSKRDSDEGLVDAEAPVSKKAKNGKVTGAKTANGEEEADAAKEEAKAETSPAEAEAAVEATKFKFDLGSTLPADLFLKNEKEEEVNVKELAEKGLVLFLVPKADTPGCTTQACAFRDAHADFSKLDYEIRCLSADTSAAQAKWQTKKDLPYPLISDPKRELILYLGAGQGGKTSRSHFIFEKGTGKLIERRIPVKPAESSKLALEFLQGLQM